MTTVSEVEEQRRRLAMHINELGLQIRTANCLEGEGINTVRELLNQTPSKLLSISNFGDKSLAEVYAALEKIGFHRRAVS